MSSKCLLLQLSNTVTTRVSDDGVVHGLTHEESLGWMKRDRWNTDNKQNNQQQQQQQQTNKTSKTMSRITQHLITQYTTHNSPVHIRVCDIFDGHGDAVFPHQHFLVICSTQELPSLVEESDRIAGLKVVVVILLHGAAATVPLIHLVVRGGAQKHVVVDGVILDCDRHTCICRCDG